MSIILLIMGVKIDFASPYKCTCLALAFFDNITILTSLILLLSRTIPEHPPLPRGHGRVIGLFRRRGDPRQRRRDEQHEEGQRQRQDRGRHRVKQGCGTPNG